jgi:hypothetical protein
MIIQINYLLFTVYSLKLDFACISNDKYEAKKLQIPSIENRQTINQDG